MYCPPYTYNVHVPTFSAIERHGSKGLYTQQILGNPVVLCSPCFHAVLVICFAYHPLSCLILAILCACCVKGKRSSLVR